MDKPTIGVGLVAVAALTVSLAKPSTKEVVAASEKPADVAVTEIAKMDPEIKPKSCSRTWVQVDNKPAALHWVCDGAFVPAQEAWLEATAGHDGQMVTLTPKTDDKGNAVYSVLVTTGAAPDQPKIEAAASEELKP